MSSTPSSPNPVDQKDITFLLRDKYENKPSPEFIQDVRRLAMGEPLAYIIGWIPFLGTKIWLDSKPLIPRPETEWWTELLISHLRERFGEEPFTLLDLCAGSGAIGIAILHALPNARVTFAEIDPAHCALITANLGRNGIQMMRTDVPEQRATVVESDGFGNLQGQTFDVIATNPPYIPNTRELADSVTKYEPGLALFSGTDGLDLIRAIVSGTAVHLNAQRELWIECDTSTIEEACTLVRAVAKDATIHDDLYGRPRLIVGHFE